MTYSDNQTGHLYVLGNASTSWTPSNDVVIGNTVDHKFNIQVKHNNVIDETTDQLDDRYILNVTCKKVAPVYFRKWVVKPLASVTPETLYSLYFYLENMQGFGMQDRWDIAATYKTDVYDNSGTPATHDTVATTMTALKDELVNKISAVGSIGNFGPIANDFIVTILDGTLAKTDADFIFGVAASNSSTSWTAGTDTESLSKGSGTVSGKKYTLVKHEGTNKVTYVYDNVADDYADNTVIVLENKNSNTYTHNDTEILMGAAPYEYDLTLSTYDGNDLWGGNPRRINAENTTTVRFASGVVVKDMENFFMRNRKDLYSLTPNFNTSIINEGNADRSKYYSMVNVHYAFSDNLGFTYFSEKDLNIAVVEASEGATTNGDTLKAMIEAKTPAGRLGTVESTVNSSTIGNVKLDERVTTLENA